jgi:hypothetical protein
MAKKRPGGLKDVGGEVLGMATESSMVEAL